MGYHERAKFKNYWESLEKQIKGMKNLFNEILSENFPDLKNEMENQVQEAYRIPNTQNYNRPTPRHIIMKIPNLQNKDRILKAAREKNEITLRRETNKDISTFFNPDPKS